MADILPATNVNPPNMLPADSYVSSASTAAADVYSADNIAAAISAPMKMPDLNDPLAVHSSIQNALGIPAIQKNVNDLLSQINDATKQAASQNTYLGNQPMAMPVITGQQAYANKLNTDKINALSGNMDVQNQFLSQLQTEAAAREGVALKERDFIDNLRTQYPGAKLKYTDSRRVMQDKINHEVRRIAKHTALNDLFMQTFNTLPKKGMSVREQKKALADAGVTNRQLEIAQKSANIASTKSTAASKTATGLFTNTQVQKLQNAGIDPSNTKSAESYLYGSTEYGQKVSTDFANLLNAGSDSITRGTDKYIDPGEFMQWRSDVLSNATTNQELTAANKKITSMQKLLNPKDAVTIKKALSISGGGAASAF